MDLAGYFASALIGLSLGLIGGGGSILTVPVLVYLFGVEPVTATAYSLFIVGATSLAGAWPKYRDHLVNLRAAAVFGLPSILAVYATRAWLVPAIPDPVVLGGWTAPKGVLLMGLFAVLMVAAAISMIRGSEAGNGPTGAPHRFNYPVILLEGTVVGMLTGLVGAGGGFLIIPALVLFAGMPMKQAVGTSLVVIAAKSLFGFLGDLSHYCLDWYLLGSVTMLAVAGVFVGNRLSRRVGGPKLRAAFGWFVLAMGCYILINEIFFSKP